MSDQSFTTTFLVDQTPEGAFGATDTPGLPVVVGRATWQAELDALLVRDEDVPWYSAQDSANALLAGRSDDLGTAGR
jgi:hypothetical protein